MEIWFVTKRHANALLWIDGYRFEGGRREVTSNGFVPLTLSTSLREATKHDLLRIAAVLVRYEVM